jgi:nucleoside-diphosphate-sugar epimerase
LITGGSGFTGGHLLKVFSEAGFECFCFGRSTPKLFSNDHKWAKHYVGDILNPTDIRAALNSSKPEYVIHLSAISSNTHENVYELYQTNILGTRALLNGLCERRVAKVIIASSSTVYGRSQSELLNESSAVQPFSDYGVSKASQELVAGMFIERLPITVVRPFNYTGVGQSGSFVVPKIIEHLSNRRNTIRLGNIDVKRDFSDVRDVALAYFKLIESAQPCSIVNIASGTAVSVREIFEIAAELCGHFPKIEVDQKLVRKNEVPFQAGDTTKLRLITSFVNRIPIRDTLKWMLEKSS